MSKKDAVVIQLRVPRAWVDRLNNLSMTRKMQEESPPMTQLDWWKTQEGLAWLAELNSGIYNGLPMSEVSNMTRKKYSESVGAKKRGRPGISDARSKVLEEALELYAQNTIRLVA